MVQFRPQAHEVIGKVVYYGPPLGGKTTNLRTLYSGYPSDSRGELVVVPTGGDRTIFFDFLPIFAGKLRGMDLRVQLYTVPGQVHYNATRQVVLRGVDGVVFVADSQRELLRSNRESWENLKENLLLQGLELADVPHVLQYNKRDLPDILPVDELDSVLNEYNAPFFESVATVGIGVEETLQAAVKLVVRSLRERFNMPLDAPLTQPVVVPRPRPEVWVRGVDGVAPVPASPAELASVTQRVVVPTPVATQPAPPPASDIPAGLPRAPVSLGGDVFAEPAEQAPALVEIDVLGDAAAAEEVRFDTLPGTETPAAPGPFGDGAEAPPAAPEPFLTAAADVPQAAATAGAPFGDVEPAEAAGAFPEADAAPPSAPPPGALELVDVLLEETPLSALPAPAPEAPPPAADEAPMVFFAAEASASVADEALAFEPPLEPVAAAAEEPDALVLDTVPPAREPAAAVLPEAGPFALDESPFPELAAPEPTAADDVFFSIVPAPAHEPEPVERVVLGELQPRIMAALGNVRELELEIPVPAKWISGKRMTVQLRLTLVPQQESDDD